MEFGLRVGDMSFLFSVNLIVIFKIVQVMTENIPFAFLYVLSIYTINMLDQINSLFCTFI